MPFKYLNLFILYFNVLIVEETDAGLLSPVVCNIALLYCYAAFFFTAFSSQWENVYTIHKYAARG